MTAQATRRERRSDGRVRLSRELIIETALELAARPGVDAIRIRDLGRELSVDPSAIYRHFQSKNDLMKALVETVGAATLAGVDTSPERDWREILVDISEVGLEFYLRYPAIGADAAAIVTEGIDIVEAILDAFHRAGLRGEALADHYVWYASYVLSVSGMIARSRIEYGDALADQPWASDVILASAETHPTANSCREEILAKRDADVFRTGVRMILDAAAAAAAADAAAAQAAPPRS